MDLNFKYPEPKPFIPELYDNENFIDEQNYGKIVINPIKEENKTNEINSEIKNDINTNENNNTSENNNSAKKGSEKNSQGTKNSNNSKSTGSKKGKK